MKKHLFRIGLRILWHAFGRIGREATEYIDEANASGLSGKQAFKHVFNRLKTKYRDINTWLLNLIIETMLGKHLADETTINCLINKQ